MRLFWEPNVYKKHWTFNRIVIFSLCLNSITIKWICNGFFQCFLTDLGLI